MRSLLISISFLLCYSNTTKGQQWIDKKYTYDSLLNVVYGSAADFNGEIVSLKMDIYLPKCDDSNQEVRKPVLMWIHGGAFLAGDKNDASIQDLSRQFARRGYVTASIDYRVGFIADDEDHFCNFPLYNCVFATDSAEWVRAYYRAVQDGKGALRFLVNRHDEFSLDLNNIFVAGESAGALAALGVGLMDTVVERPLQTFAIESTPLPHANSLACPYNAGKIFTGNSITRPDLGPIAGSVEPTAFDYTIKGIGNMYGAMYDDLLEHRSTNHPKPAIYSFHQPCDIVVPIDSADVYWGYTWCFSNGFGCGGITNNNVTLYGSRTFSNWNSQNDYGYTIHNDFTNINFPFSFLFGPGSCLDQTNNPCHAYDNKVLREHNLAAFFAELISTNPVCDSGFISGINEHNLKGIRIYPNPSNEILLIESDIEKPIANWIIYDLTGIIQIQENGLNTNQFTIDVSDFSPGTYFIQTTDFEGKSVLTKIVKQ